MKTEELKELGLSDEQITEVFKLNGLDINKTKEKLEGERDNYKGQLETAQTALKDFEGIDVKDLQGKLKTLETDLATKESEWQGKLADRDFTDNLKSIASKHKARDFEAVRPFLNLDSLKQSKNQTEDIEKAFATVKESKAYLFESDEPFYNPVGVTTTRIPKKKISVEELSKLDFAAYKEARKNM